MHTHNAIEAKEEGKSKEEEMKKFWWSMYSDNFALMYGQEVDALADQKISAEEANKAAREAQEAEIGEEEDLSKEEESSEEEDHHMEDIAEDKTNHPKRGPYSTAFATIETVFKMMDEDDEDLWIGDSGASSYLIGSEKCVFNEEANKAAREAQEVEIGEEEDLSKEEESSEEEDHHMEDIAEDKTIHPKRGPYSTAFATIETVFKMMDEDDEDLWIGDSGASSYLIGSEKCVFNKKMIKGSANTANGEKMK